VLVEMQDNIDEPRNQAEDPRVRAEKPSAYAL
jgi:hypothetical protein